MKLSDLMGSAGLSRYAEIALIVFLAVFALIVVRTFWPSRRPEMDRMGRLPLEDSDLSRERGQR
jgi:cbb3-type cytochrome oxidase subunit 3